jgi:hypothetical protein
MKRLLQLLSARRMSQIARLVSRRSRHDSECLVLFLTIFRHDSHPLTLVRRDSHPLTLVRHDSHPLTLVSSMSLGPVLEDGNHDGPVLGDGNHDGPVLGDGNHDGRSSEIEQDIPNHDETVVTPGAQFETFVAPREAEGVAS